MTGFYLGTHRPHWLEQLNRPLFVSRRVLAGRRTLPTRTAPWVLDSGGFTELNLHGEWRLTTDTYADEIRRYQRIGGLQWAAPMDWMCEPSVLTRTGRTVAEHQALTVANFLALREQVGSIVAPVVQGWTLDEYHDCVQLYADAGVDLSAEPVVGVGSVCRRSAVTDVCRVLRSLWERHGLSLHGFGIKGDALALCADFLASADSMAWSFNARNTHPLPGCEHRSCQNCIRYATRWHDRQVARLRAAEQTLWSTA